ncbi:hypothetical protein [Chryseobacterium sp. JM1]|uniref:hypothetical protein n=1 Tax=Chryseobacterium sp. JM1 TaxID=1233950 RepID=UPI0004E72246|nr:hypothetical protein [Chryseobacterium sp. JM1]KFF21609.1 hypothetical protein IW22_06555 [Chryseobacterium sp. JM1]
MLLENKGIETDTFCIPPFGLNVGDIVVLNLFSGPHFYETAMFLSDIFCGRVSHENVVIHQDMTFVEHFSESAVKSFFNPVTVGKYLKKNAHSDCPYTTQVYETASINEKTKVNTLDRTLRKILSLYATLSKTKNIVFDLRGQGPQGAKEIYDTVKDVVKNGGSAILLDGFDDMKNDCTKYVEIQWRKSV